MEKTILIPHNYKPRGYQLDFLKNSKRFNVLVWHRRSGKSKTVFNMQLIKALKTKGIYYYFLPTYKQAKSVVWETFIDEHIPAEIITKKNESDLIIELKNGSIMHYAGCDDIDRHRGINPIDVVFDEYSEMKEEIWTAIIQPVLRENNGTATFVYTPKGQNHSFNLYNANKDKDNWYVSLKSVDDTNAITRDELDEAKESMPQALYYQEFMCNFLEDASSVFRNIDNRVSEFDVYPEDGKRYQLGVDLAKHNDFTCISITDKHTFKTKLLDRFNKIDWDLQISKIESYARRYNNAEVWVDSTGVGDPIYDILYNKGLNIQSFRFTERSREQLLNNLSILIEQNKIDISKDDILIDELKSFKYVLKGTKVKAEVPSNYHDDAVMSLALAVWGLDRRLPSPEYDNDTVTLIKQSYV